MSIDIREVAEPVVNDAVLTREVAGDAVVEGPDLILQGDAGGGGAVVGLVDAGGRHVQRGLADVGEGGGGGVGARTKPNRAHVNRTGAVR